MWFKIKSYFTFLLKSTNQHGVHSPFVYDLVTKCFYKKTKLQDKNLFKKIKKRLLSNHKTIEITDFGKGSKVFKNNLRIVSKITKVAGISNKRAYLLITIIKYFNFQNMLEIGTSVGLGTNAMYIGNPKASISTLEGCENTANIAQESFNYFNFKNINLVIGNFQNTLPIILETTNFDLVYFDGNHQKKPTLDYFKSCLEQAQNNSVYIFDDINWSQEMQNTWNEIKEHPKVTVTIDIFYWGIVFFRKEQQKQHFTIRV